MGLPGILNSDSDYLLVALSLSSSFDVGYFNNLDVQVEFGSFVNNNNVHFANFHHFVNNPSFFVFNDIDYSYRTLPSYTYSTSSNYINLHSRMTFDKLILTQFEAVASVGFTEYLILNALNTPDVTFAEVGYGLEFNGLVRFEFLHSFGDFQVFNFKGSIGL